MIVSFFLGAYKWKILFHVFYPQSQFNDFLKACFKASFIANFMFGTLIGDGARIYDIAKKYKVSYQRSLVIGLIDRGLMLIFYLISVCLIFISFYLLKNYSNNIQIGFLLCLLIFFSIITYRYASTISNLKIIHYHELLNIHFFILYFSSAFLSTVFIGLAFIFLAFAASFTLQINTITYILLGLLSNFFPLSFSGWGVRELTLSVILSNFASSDAIITTSILFGILNALIALPGIVIYLKHRKV
jgi:hypothetical protein